MSIPEGAPQGAVHVQPDEGSVHAQPWRARTRDSVPAGKSDPLTLTERSRQLIAERWGKPVEEPAPEPPPDDGEAPRPLRLRDGFNHLHFVRDPMPSLRAARADYRNGLEAVRSSGLIAVGLYRLVGLFSQPIGWTAGFVYTNSIRPGRFVALVFVAALFWAAYKIAI